MGASLWSSVNRLRLLCLFPHSSSPLTSTASGCSLGPLSAAWPPAHRLLSPVETPSILRATITALIQIPFLPAPPRLPPPRPPLSTFSLSVIAWRFIFFSWKLFISFCYSIGSRRSAGKSVIFHLISSPTDWELLYSCSSVGSLSTFSVIFLLFSWFSMNSFFF